MILPRLQILRGPQPLSAVTVASAEIRTLAVFFTPQTLIALIVNSPVIGRNDDGLPNLPIGSLEERRYGAINDNDVWIKEVQVYDYALDCDFTNNLEPTVDCGNGGELVESCTECTIGVGDPSGYKGDYGWDGTIAICKDADPSASIVDCGDHHATDSGICDASSADTAGCAGDCKWHPASDSCIDEDYCIALTDTNVALASLGAFINILKIFFNHHDQNLEPSVDCEKGGELVESCTECTVGNDSGSGCGGDCVFDKEAPICEEKDDDPLTCLRGIKTH